MNRLKSFVPFLITFFIIFLFYFKKMFFLKFYPPVCNFIFFLIFFISLFTKETIIHKIVKIYDKTLGIEGFNYIRKISYIWCIFIFINLIISIWTIFLNDKIWMIYNGCISYVLMGLLFGIEYLVRKILQKRKII